MPVFFVIISGLGQDKQSCLVVESVFDVYHFKYILLIFVKNLLCGLFCSCIDFRWLYLPLVS